MNRLRKSARDNPMALHIMLLPSVLFLLVFSYVPMAGLIMAFQKFNPKRGYFGSPFVGLNNFTYMLSLPDTGRVIINTVVIAVLKIVLMLLVPIVVSLLLNEIRSKAFSRGVQLVLYLPHFLSWVILGGILVDILSPSSGVINGAIKALGFEPIYFLGDPEWFRFTIVSSDVWKEFGYNMIIYLSALTAIDPALYEAAAIDGAGRWKQTVHITLPSLLSIIVLLATLSLGNVLNAGFDQIFNLYSPQVYDTGDIIDTLVYRLGIVDAQYSVSTAVGLFKSVVSCSLISLSYWLASRYAGYRIF